jgi:sensor histidine kinase YesM
MAALITIEKKGDKINLNDIGFRLILIPFFGIVIAAYVGLVDHSHYSHLKIKLAYLFTIFIAFVVWHGNRYLLFFLRTFFNWFEHPLRKVVVLIFSIVGFTITASLLLHFAYFYLFESGRVDWQKVQLSTLIIVIAVLFIAHVYEMAFTVKEAEGEMVKRAETEKAKAEAELNALKAQIDPHFIFNSLNTLSFLIESEPQKAAVFNANLASVYRYILNQRNSNLVTLEDELAFLDAYFSMIKLRHGQAVALHLRGLPTDVSQFLLPPISIQQLVENAIKHNEFSESSPLHITVEWSAVAITVTNGHTPKKFPAPSAKTGLDNLNTRYQLIAGKGIEIKVDKKYFSVVLPTIQW